MRLHSARVLTLKKSLQYFILGILLPLPLILSDFDAAFIKNNLMFAALAVDLRGVQHGSNGLITLKNNNTNNMELKEIQNLIKFVAKSGVNEVHVEMGETKVTIKTGADVVQQVVTKPAAIEVTPAGGTCDNTNGTYRVNTCSSGTVVKTTITLRSNRRLSVPLS